MNWARAVLLLLAVNFSKWFGEQIGSCIVHSSPRDPKSHCFAITPQPASHSAGLNVFNAMLDAEVPLTGQHRHPCEKLCIHSGSSCSYLGRVSELRLGIDEVGQAQPYSELCWSPWGYIWAEFALPIEVSSGSCVVTARTGRNLCWSVTLSLWTLSRMWWHPPQDTASCLVPLHAAASPSRPGCVSVAGEWFSFPTEPSPTFSCHQCLWEKAVPWHCLGSEKELQGVSLPAVPAAVAPEAVDAPWSCAVQERVGLCLQKGALSSCALFPSAGCAGPEAALCSCDVDSGLDGAS